MGTRNGYKVIDNVDMTAPNEWQMRTSTNYGFYIQSFWTGLAGSAKWELQASNDGVNWETWPQYLPIAKEVVLERVITGTSGKSSFEKGEWFPDWMKIVYVPDTASAGNISFTITMINKQDMQ